MFVLTHSRPTLCFLLSSLAIFVFLSSSSAHFASSSLTSSLAFFLFRSVLCFIFSTPFISCLHFPFLPCLLFLWLLLLLQVFFRVILLTASLPLSPRIGLHMKPKLLLFTSLHSREQSPPFHRLSRHSQTRSQSISQKTSEPGCTAAGKRSRGIRQGKTTVVDLSLCSCEV